MSNIANITVYDGAATPVAHTLVPISVSKPSAGKILAEWRETGLSGVPAYAQVRLSISAERLKSGVYRTESRLVVPVMESVSGQNVSGYTAAPKVAYENTYILTGLFHERSTTNDRRVGRMLLVNLANNVGTSVAAQTAGFVPELVDSLIAPT